MYFKINYSDTNKNNNAAKIDQKILNLPIIFANITQITTLNLL